LPFKPLSLRQWNAPREAGCSANGSDPRLLQDIVVVPVDPSSILPPIPSSLLLLLVLVLFLFLVLLRAAARATREPLDRLDPKETLERTVTTVLPVKTELLERKERSFPLQRRPSPASSAHQGPREQWEKWDPKDLPAPAELLVWLAPMGRRESEEWLVSSELLVNPARLDPKDPKETTAKSSLSKALLAPLVQLERKDPKAQRDPLERMARKEDKELKDLPARLEISEPRELPVQPDPKVLLANLVPRALANTAPFLVLLPVIKPSYRAALSSLLY